MTGSCGSSARSQKSLMFLGVVPHAHYAKRSNIQQRFHPGKESPSIAQTIQAAVDRAGHRFKIVTVGNGVNPAPFPVPTGDVNT